MAKGKDDIGILADCAAVALIVRPNAAVSSVFLRFMGEEGVCSRCSVVRLARTKRYARENSRIVQDGCV